MTRGASSLILLLVACGASAPAWSQNDAPYDAEYDNAEYDNEDDNAAWLHALLDVRIAGAGPAKSWTDHGPGKLRYGSRSDAAGAHHDTQLVLSQLALQLGMALPWDIRAQAQLNVQPDVADSYEPWLIEAFLRREWGTPGTGAGLQAGLMTNPFSLEHTGPAWTPKYSLSPAALNSWLWEEISLAGLEGEWWHETGAGPRVGISAGLGYGPDQLGRLLALRGWAMGDVVTGLNSDLPLPNGTRTDIFDERDHRPATYVWLTLADRNDRGALKAGYLDNGGDLNVTGVWQTRLATVGAIIHPLPAVDLIVQYLRGKALVRDTSNDSSLRAFYALLSSRYQAHRFTVRYDEFRVGDLDGGNSTREHGDAVTAAYAFEWGLRQSIGLEYIWLSSERPRNASAQQSQDGWQVRYRLRY